MTSPIKRAARALALKESGTDCYDDLDDAQQQTLQESVRVVLEAAAVGDLEEKLRSLIRGKHSSIILSFNDECGPNYTSVARDEEEGAGSHGDWVSEDERQKAIAGNSKWILQWYPETPVGFCAIAASSIKPLIDAALSE